MIDNQDQFYLGRIYDPQSRQPSDRILFYDPDDLTTHAVVVGMTGSGKTGLCIDLLEEAALNNVPALMIDPKGDITNTLLHFPQLAPGDFLPWINVDEARRQGKTVEQQAQDVADLWRHGLAQWDIKPERIQALKDGPRFAIYTPGSSAGLPLSILASLAAPAISWDSHQELLREKISGTVIALLGLIGLRDVDPVRTREHILLANIFEHAWSQGKDLDLGELIMQTQSPPFEKLGVFDVNRFFPEGERFELAMSLNNILAAPAFQPWIEGEPLDIPNLLYDASGRARHSIFYIAHLPEAERMFFVTLFYSAVESWMRAQSGTTSLRALVYFDEIAGYLPPVSNPPAKEPMMRMLKQARAFGVGLVLAAQNPADIDYKALSNTGTWFIGKLATEQDKQRLLDGLSSAMPGGLDQREYDQLISSLDKRVFLLRNVHEKQPQLFHTRWAMNYLAGPITRAQIPDLNALTGATLAATPAMPTDYAAASSPPPPIINIRIGAATRPTVPSRVMEYFLPNNLTLSQAAKASGHSLPTETKSSGLLYQPVLLAQANIRFLNRKYSLNHEMRQTALVHEPDRRGMVRWDNHLVKAIEPRSLDSAPVPEARFADLEAPLIDATVLRSLQSDYTDWIYHTCQVTVSANESLNVYAGPDVSADAFKKMCDEAAEAKADIAIDKLEAQYERKIESIEKKLSREEAELREDEAELAHRKREELGTHAETLLSLFSKRRRSVSSSLSKRRMTEKAKADVEESVEAIADFKKELQDLAQEMETALDELKEHWAEIAADITEIPVTPYKKDIDLALFGVAWFPYYLIQTGERITELPGYEEDDA
jgi:hypothetical protein